MNVSTATTAELIAFFNANTGGNPVKKFADRKTAERRVQALVDEIASEAPAVISPDLRNPGDVFGSAIEAAKVSKPDSTLAKVEFTPSYNHRVCPKCGSTDIFNGRTKGGLVVDEDTVAGCHNCDWVQDDGKASEKPSTPTGKLRPEMAASLKLDRQIKDETAGIVYKNACQVWKAGLISSSQCDRLSATLYGAAKQGNRLISVSINCHVFTLANKV